jgi:hypothetical protein
MTMAERYEDDYIVPFEMGLQSSETILMWGLGGLAWLISLISMGFLLGWNVTAFGMIMYAFGLILVLGSQIVSSYDPIKTTRFPVNGLLLWLWILVLSFFILLKGWSVYIGSSGTGTVIFIIAFIAISILATGGLLVANFLTSTKIVTWMNQPMNTFFLVAGIGATLASVLHMGFSNSDLMFIDKLSFMDWLLIAVFAFSYLLFIELNHAAHRFNEIISYAKKKAVGEFSLTPVINNYYIMGFILMVIVLVAFITLLVVNFFLRWVAPFFNENVADSVMMNTVYSLFLTSMVLLIPLFIVMILFFSYRAKKEKEEEDALRRNAEKSQRAVY